VPAAELQPERIQQQWEARLRQMGLAWRPMAGGRTLLVSLPLGETPFDSVDGPFRLQRMIFATVGPHHIKCLRPRPLFGLPLLDVRRCSAAASIESAIRRSWDDRTRQLRDARGSLEEIGLDTEVQAGGSMLGVALPGERPDAHVILHDRQAAILPGSGPLSGIPLEKAEDRILPLPTRLGAAADFECLISARLDSLRQDALERDAATRSPGVGRGSGTVSTTTDAKRADKRQRFAATQRRVLVVGPQLTEDAGLRHELKRQGYRIASARSETEAVARLAGMTPDLVLSQYSLNRSDGATLVQTTRSLPGIEGMPIVLLDDAKLESRREAARTVGAAGYLILPSDKARFVARLGKLLTTASERRYTRYPQRLAARLEDYEIQCLATQVGRGGVFITMAEDVAPHSAMRGEVMLPEIGRPVCFDGEVLYRTEGQGDWPGLGLRFQAISPEDEAALIEYLTRLESHR
jgi:two-component system chemotaxis response regulator CheY